MSGVFLSYSREDRDFASAIISGLRSVGAVVWWDEDMHSLDWHQELERQIVELATIVVVWSPHSVNSANVKDEARLGLENSKLINVIVGLAKPPFPFDRVNGLPMDGWVDGEPHSGWTRLIESIEEKVVAKGGAKKGELTGNLAKREESQKLKHQALVRAQEALVEAQVREAETVDAAEAAQTTFIRAEEQHVRVMEMHATHLIMSAAAQEYEAARAAKEDADRALRAARTEVKGATREVALAAAAVEHPEAPPPERRPKAAAPVLGAATVAPEPVTAPSVSSAAAEPAVGKAKASPAEPPAPAVAASPATAAPSPETDNRAAPRAAVPAAASSTPASEPKRASGSGRAPLILVAAAMVLGAIIAGFVLLGQRSKPSAAPAATSATTLAAGRGSGAATDPKAAAIKAAAVIAGNWAPVGLPCDSPIIIAVKDGAVSMTVAGATSTAAIQSSPAPGVIDARSDAGGAYVYTLGGDNTLSMVGPDNQPTKMSKCAG